MQKYNKRKEGLDKLLQRPSLSLQERAKWVVVQNVLVKLGKDGQSTDESDSDGQGLHTTIPSYRRRIITPIFVDLDQQIKTVTQTELQQQGWSTRRSNVIRRRTDIRSNRTVVRSLPCSFYHSPYLTGLGVTALGSLEIDSSEIANFNEWATLAMPNSDTEADI